MRIIYLTSVQMFSIKKTIDQVKGSRCTLIILGLSNPYKPGPREWLGSPKQAVSYYQQIVLVCLPIYEDQASKGWLVKCLLKSNVSKCLQIFIYGIYSFMRCFVLIKSTMVIVNIYSILHFYLNKHYWMINLTNIRDEVVNLLTHYS